jgi:hypothetical protein
VTAEALLESWNDTPARRATTAFVQAASSEGDARTLYGIPPERVIGSAFGLDFDASGADTQLMYKSKFEFFDDGPQKPVRIWSRQGRLGYGLRRPMMPRTRTGAAITRRG